MIENIIIGVLTYYATLFVVVYKCNFRKMLGLKSDFQYKQYLRLKSFPGLGRTTVSSVQESINEKFDEDNLIKKSIYQCHSLPQAATSSESEKTIEKAPIFVPLQERNTLKIVTKEQLDEAFTEIPKPMNIPADEEEEETDLEEEETAFEPYRAEGVQEHATGFTLNELGELHNALQKEEIPEKGKPRIRKIIRKVEGTDMFEMMASLVVGCPKKILDILDESTNHIITTKKDTTPKEIDNDRLNNFNIGNYL